MSPVKVTYHTIKNLFWNTSVALAHSIHRLTHDYTYIDSVLKRYEQEGIKTDRFQPYKLWCLVVLLEKHKPKNILEMGSGSSTTIFSNYADKNAAKVTTLETDGQWATLVRRHIGKNVTILECSASGDAQSQPKALRFDVNLGNQEFDFVLIDGPGDKFPGIAKKEGATMNGVELAIPPKMFVIDGRKTTVNYMRQHAKLKSYSFKANELHTNMLLCSGYNFFSTFEKT